MHHDHVTTDEQLAALCQRLATAETIAFDTEFVSEHSYRPELCLIQVAAGDVLAVIDPQPIRDVTPFWEVLATPGHATIVHAGREELLFCLAATGRPPHELFDVQIAAGLVGFEYPAGYGSLLSKLMGLRLHKGETRTDWRRRPLSTGQIEYALDDVRYLAEMAGKLQKRLVELREAIGWSRRWPAGNRTSRPPAPTSGGGKSRARRACRAAGWPSCARSGGGAKREAHRRNCPPRRVLRDDLIIELAKRRSADPKQIRAVRGMERGDLQRAIPQLAEAVERALAVPDDQCPQPMQRDGPSQLTVLGQFLSSALGSICRSAELAPSIVGTASDVRDLVAYRLGLAEGNGDAEPPLLGRGWRRRGRRPLDRRSARGQAGHPHPRSPAPTSRWASKP